MSRGLSFKHDQNKQIPTKMLISFHADHISQVSKLLLDFEGLKLNNNQLEVESGHELFSILQDQSILFDIIDVVKLRLFGMTCTSCSGAIEENINLLNGVLDCTVNLAMEYCVVKYFKKTIGVRDIITRIEELGFDALMMDMGASIQLEHLQKTKDIIELRNAFQQSLYYTIPTMLLMFVHQSPQFYNIYLTHAVQCVLATIAMCTVGSKFYIHAYHGLFTRSFTMDTLVALGTLSAYVFSLLMMIHHCFNKKEHLVVFFDTTTMLITFILLGKFMETSARVKTSSALGTLLKLKPDKARLVEFNKQGKQLLSDYKLHSTTINWKELDALVDKESSISTDLIQYGDCLSILPGERIPADGFVIWGSTVIDESLITGESLPVSKAINDPVICGSINGSCPFKMYANAVGTDTALHRIIKLVELAQSVKAPIAIISDAIASVFVPFVVILALITFIVWYVILNVLDPVYNKSLFDYLGTHGSTDTLFLCVKICISVVVIACPCTLGLAVPTSVMVGTGVGAKLGILIKGGGSLEMANKLTTIVFDKTGTLTTGKMSIINVSSTIKLKDLWAIVGACELQSEHPIGQALVKYAKSLLNWDVEAFKQHLTINEIENKPGFGLLVSANDEKTEKSILIGNEPLLVQHGIDCTQMNSFKDANAQLGHTVIYISINSELVASIAMGDELKPWALECVQGLQKMDIEVIMCSGDNKQTAQAVAKQCGISSVFAEMTPVQKSLLIKEIKEEASNRPVGWFDYFIYRFKEEKQRNNKVVGFVGDGINDAVALAEADVGIALGSGTDVAMETADVILMKSELLDVVTAIDLSRHIFKRIKINFIWAFGYNIVSIPLAMGFGIPFGIFLHPMVAGAAMAFSSVSVVTSSLFLKFYKVPLWIRKLKGQAVQRNWRQRIVFNIRRLFGRTTSRATEYHQL